MEKIRDQIVSKSGRSQDTISRLIRATLDHSKICEAHLNNQVATEPDADCPRCRMEVYAKAASEAPIYPNSREEVIPSDAD
ncbi:hypothetical protein LCGC14_2670970 [marine sediment metagenome]|uniref:Uncharacterized protein n=1 Tax=marine sediment metagenome TaxID=412755 RepID=A0A0F9BZ34_9ZZZZ